MKKPASRIPPLGKYPSPMENLVSPKNSLMEPTMAASATTTASQYQDSIWYNEEQACNVSLSYEQRL